MMGKFIDMTNQRFGKWLVLEKGQSKNKILYWKCRCECGVEKEVRGSSLRNGQSTSCGCGLAEKRAAQREDLTGKTFNKLKVLKEVGKDNRGYLWECECECGNTTIASTTDLKRNWKKSCGCQQLMVLNKKQYEGQTFGLLTVLRELPERQNQRVMWECQCKCGKITKVSTSDLTNGHTTSCGCRKESKGEEKIRKILQGSKIPFETQKTFKSCVFPDTQKNAFFDFYIDNNYLIEFDGSQHFETGTGYYDNIEAFKRTQYRDNFKTQWCKENNITLIRIPYYHLDQLTIKDLLIETSNFIV